MYLLGWELNQGDYGGLNGAIPHDGSRKKIFF